MGCSDDDDDDGIAPAPVSITQTLPGLGLTTLETAVTAADLAIGLPKLAPYLVYNTHGRHDVGTVTVSKKTWNKLTEQQQAALRMTANYVGELRKGIRGAEQALLAKAEQGGATVIRPSGATLAGWRAASGPAQQALVESIGGNAVQMWSDIMAAKKACGSS